MLRLHTKDSAGAEEQEDNQDSEGNRIFPTGLNLPNSEVFNDPQEKSAEHGPRYATNAADDRGNDA
jgi:hypothetical protein